MDEFRLWRDHPLHILFVMATEQEYGPALRRRIQPLITGVGPVEAASVTSHALARLEREHDLPQLVVSLGSAGSRKLEHAKIYQLSSVCYRDMDCTPLGFERGVVPFLGEPAVIEIREQIPGLASASIATGASIVSGAMYDTIEADMVDMESYAVYRAAEPLRGADDRAARYHRRQERAFAIRGLGELSGNRRPKARDRTR